MPRNENIQQEPKSQVRGKQDENRNEGEGSRSADAAYRKGLERFEQEGKVEDNAERAKRALDEDEGDELKRAEERGKAGPD